MTVYNKWPCTSIGTRRIGKPCTGAPKPSYRTGPHALIRIRKYTLFFTYNSKIIIYRKVSRYKNVRNLRGKKDCLVIPSEP